MKDVTKDDAPMIFHGASSGRRYQITGRKGSVFVFAEAGLQGGSANKTDHICFNISFVWLTTYYEKLYMKHYHFNGQHQVTPCLPPLITGMVTPTFRQQLKFVIETRRSDNKFWRCPTQGCLNNVNLVYPNSANICQLCLTIKPEDAVMYSAQEFTEKQILFKAEQAARQNQMTTVQNTSAPDPSAPVSGRTPSASQPAAPSTREMLIKEREALRRYMQFTESVLTEQIAEAEIRADPMQLDEDADAR